MELEIKLWVQKKLQIELNASGKSVRSKTAASSDYFSANATEATEIKAMFDNYISIQTTEVFDN